MRGNEAEQRMGRGVRRIVGGIVDRISSKKSKPKSSRRFRRRGKSIPTEAERQSAFKTKLKKNRQT